MHTLTLNKLISVLLKLYLKKSTYYLCITMLTNLLINWAYYEYVSIWSVIYLPTYLSVLSIITIICHPNIFGKLNKMKICYETLNGDFLQSIQSELGNTIFGGVKHFLRYYTTMICGSWEFNPIQQNFFSLVINFMKGAWLTKIYKKCSLAGW